jgi:AraC-like DNA-binding protein
MTSDPDLASYFAVVAENDRPSIRQIMETNFCFNLKLEEYADLCCRSLSSFKRDFEEIFDESPGRWLQQRRVRHAATLLTTTDLSVTQVAFESGFEDLSHFSRSFKQITGASPTAYRTSR